MITDPFAVLGVAETASDEEVRRRYLDLVRRWSPDRAPERFHAVRDAYQAIASRRGRLHQRLAASGPAGADRLLAALVASSGAADHRPAAATLAAVLIETATAALEATTDASSARAGTDRSGAGG